MIEIEASQQIITVKETLNNMKEEIDNSIETTSNPIEMLNHMIEITNNTIETINKHKDIETNLKKEILESEDSQKTDQTKPEAINPTGKMKLPEETSSTNSTLT